MRPTFTIIPQLSSKNQLTLHPETAAKLSVKEGDHRVIRFGLQAIGVKISLSPKLSLQEIVLAQRLIEALRIPLTPSYELQAKRGQLELGPYIGILAFRTDSTLEQSVASLESYVYDYETIGGAVLAFSLEGVGATEGMIDGYAYNPLTRSWDRGKYSYPRAIFQRIKTSAKWRDHFQSVLGDRVFNNYVFDKWEMFQWLSGLSHLAAHLPETAMVPNIADVLGFLERYRSAYIKPVLGSQGKGIIKVDQKADCITVRTKSGNDSNEITCFTHQQLETALGNALAQDRCIIQQAIPLAKHEEQIIDFRLIVVKDGHGQWVVPGMIGRYSKPHEITSNISGGGTAETGEQTLSKVFSCTSEELYTLRKRMHSVGIAAAQGIEAAGVHSGNLGVDLGLDPDRNIWIIEINNRDPNHTIAIDAGDRQLFYQIKRLNMQYAKYLAGFTEV